ncbi:ABSCISIC ACID-INSENSITIVE 5-like protein 4 isoform X1 [Salvia hispanica]|uniref:ABSCISIC ACID-INSENSITIVE 5-like protein 4 isoform X1 n=1 Tax=Salvia hispanica TaxID=49212 RepID=UPI0020099311|nr:ABSCISIC ACID-INSENSITIVE 5-like protein 4 isoform X1 [Salvia hispanica]
MLMASPRVIASNSDLPRDSPPSSINIHSDQPARGFGSMNMDEIFRNICPDSASFDAGAGEAAAAGGFLPGDGGLRSVKTTEEVWRDIVIGGGGEAAAMTLEAFLTKAGAVNEEEVGVPAPPPVGGFGMEGVMVNPAPAGAQFAPAGCVQNVIGGMEFGSGSVGGGGGRGKRRVAVDEVPLDKATQQKQRRMIKNRESAARSRERKQAYTVEMEAQVTALEDEHARLLRQEAEMNRERYKQLMENIIPVVEKRRPPRVLRSTRSM